jgi:hypothetical protein
MTGDRPIHRSATREQQIIAERAEDLAERRGIYRGISLSVAFLETTGHSVAARALRDATLIVSPGAAQP